MNPLSAETDRIDDNLVSTYEKADHLNQARERSEKLDIKTAKGPRQCMPNLLTREHEELVDENEELVS